MTMDYWMVDGKFISVVENKDGHGSTTRHWYHEGKMIFDEAVIEEFQAKRIRRSLNRGWMKLGDVLEFHELWTLPFISSEVAQQANAARLTGTKRFVVNTDYTVSAS